MWVGFGSGYDLLQQRKQVALRADADERVHVRRGPQVCLFSLGNLRALQGRWFGILTGRWVFVFSRHFVRLYPQPFGSIWQKKVDKVMKTQRKWRLQAQLRGKAPLCSLAEGRGNAVRDGGGGGAATRGGAAIEALGGHGAKPLVLAEPRALVSLGESARHDPKVTSSQTSLECFLHIVRRSTIDTWRLSGVVRGRSLQMKWVFPNFQDSRCWVFWRLIPVAVEAAGCLPTFPHSGACWLAPSRSQTTAFALLQTSCSSGYQQERRPLAN